MKRRTLRDIVEAILALDQTATIYARKPWHPDSPAIVVREPAGGGLPSEASAEGLAYFLEVDIAVEVFNGLGANSLLPHSSLARCQRLIEYAVNDA